ncbi:hypothetical protein BGZ57DRAFT_894552 [Hyaloscypha finlandica]|nr:hypothetical protein BGZ57DRAFT_894552 [Hyaloscypha finlandica]KAH8797573.1 hypothetical protein F5882DRAFT_396014 [Hyaloscypha sp. PMI_1271]
MRQFHGPRYRRTAESSAGNEAAGPSQRRRHCIALLQDGAECYRLLQRPDHELCPPHHREYKELCGRYKDAEEHYNRLVEPEIGLEVEGVKEKIAWGRKTVDLRNQVNRRFFSQHAGNRGHIQWILKLEGKIKALEGTLKSEGDHGKSPPLPEDTEANNQEHEPEQRVYRSLLSPEIHMSALDHLPADSVFKLAKQEMLIFSEELVTRLYNIASSLNDSAATLEQPGCETRIEPDEGDLVVRFVFREFLLWKADADTLARANKAESIDAFLRRCFPSELQDYIKFFELFGRVDTLHFLRDAICDYLLPPGASPTVILGGVVATEDKQRRMTIEGWDILYSYFSDVVEWCNVEQFCVRSEDMSLIKRLVALHRYSKARDGEPEWLDKDNDVSQECPFAVLQGFVGITKGYSDPPITPVTTKDGITIERRSRCYLTGRMAKNEPLAKDLIKELVNRVARYIVIVYDMESNEYGFREVVSRSDELEESPWITRTRSVAVGESLQNALWKIEWSLKDVLSDLELIQRLRDRNMARDYYEFIIIDRNPGGAFNILDDVADALIQLAGDPPVQEIINKAVQRSFPMDQQRQVLEAITLDVSSAVDLNIPNVHYEGSRVRSWSVLDNNSGIFRIKPKRSKSDLRITAKILAEMESHGLITSLKTFQPPHTCPAVVRGTDGLEDLYFDYYLGPTDESALRRSRLISPEISLSAESLYEFAQTFRAAHPDAVFAKGKIHVHYCAWPMPAMRHGALGIPTFRTVEGHLFRWNVLPFDSPLSSRIWQYFIHCETNSKLPFVRFVQTTFVVCAKSPEDAEANLKILLAAAAKHDWKLSVPPPSLWTVDFESLDLQTLWVGIHPAMYRRTDDLCELQTALEAEPAGNVSTSSLQ